MTDDYRSEAEALTAEHDRLTNERARLVLDGVDPDELEMPLSPRTPAPPAGFDLPGGESTAAALRRVEQERDEAVRRSADLEQVRGQLTQARLLLEAYERDLEKLTGERNELVNRSLALKAELASAQQELERLRGRGGDQ